MSYYKEYTPTNMSVYEYLVHKTGDFSSLDAIKFYTKTYSYKVMHEKILETARALRAMGIGKDDIVASSLPGMPEGIFLIYAINMIGAVYCAFDCRSKKAEVKETIATFKPKLCVIPDFQIQEFEGVTECPIVHITPPHSLGAPADIAAFFANIFKSRTPVLMKHKNIIGYEKFMKGAESFTGDIEACTSTDNIFGYFYTSGTTYGRKSIILSNENINAAVIQHTINLQHITPGESILNIMPLFTCYSVTIAVQMPLINGVTVNLIPLANPKKFKELLIKQKPNYIITVPAHWEYFVHEKYDGVDLSFLKTVIVGGDTTDANYRKKINEIFASCNSPARISPGYGLSETTSSTTSCLGIRPGPDGSVGYPLPNVMVKIFEKGTDTELPPYEKGEICMWGPTNCLGYFKDPEMTDMLLKKHADGKIWLHSGDCGYLDEDGALYFCERFKRMYVRFDGTKVSPFSIEQVILTCPEVAKCMVVSIPDEEHTYGMCAKAIVVPAEGVDPASFKDKIEKFCKKNLDMHMIPAKIEVAEKLRYTKNGKLDYFGAQNSEN